VKILKRLAYCIVVAIKAPLTFLAVPYILVDKVDEVMNNEGWW